MSSISPLSLAGARVEERFDGGERIAEVVVQARGKDAEADEPVGHHQPLQREHLLVEEEVAFALDEEKIPSRA